MEKKKNHGDCLMSLYFSDSSWDKPKYLCILKYHRIKVIAAKYNKTTEHVLIRFLIHGRLVVISKSMTPEHISEKIKVFDFKLNTRT